MRRREFVVAFAGAAVGWSPASAEVKTPRIGFVQPGSREENQGLLDAFRDGLSKLGWSDGGKAAILDRWAEDDTERLAGIVKELSSAGVAVLLTGGSLATLAAKRQNATIPIVFVGVDDPVALGVVDALGQPGRNATGLSLTSS